MSTGSNNNPSSSGSTLSNLVVQFINTFHGEFPNVCRICTLVRFRGCNLKCTFCDTKIEPDTPPVFTNDSQLLENLVLAVKHTRNLLITGGEPGLYPQHVATIINHVLETDVFVESIQIETNGLFLDNFKTFLSNLSSTAVNVLPSILYVVWSPKFVDDKEKDVNLISRLYGNNFTNLYSNCYIKLVDNPQWKDYTEHFVKVAETLYGVTVKNRLSLMYMTDGNTGSDTIRYTLDKCLKLGINVSPRIHLVFNMP